MRRLVIAAVAAVAAGGIAATPALAGLAGNPSFSQQIPVPIPSQAQSGSLAGQHAEPGGNKGSLTPSLGPSNQPVVTPSDDHGGASPSAEVSDSHGGGGGGPGPG